MAGRPSSYKSEYDEQAYKLCLLGAKDSQLADFFGVTEQTINGWKKKHPSFFESLKDGKQRADAMVAASLYHRAIGYSHSEDKIFNNNGEPMVVPTTKHYAPDTTAAIFWLKNRQPEQWRDKQDVDVSGDIRYVVSGDPLSEDEWNKQYGRSGGHSQAPSTH